jgi:hypothetical protein
VLLNAFPDQRHGMAVALVGPAALIGPLAGPTLGG